MMSEEASDEPSEGETLEISLAPDLDYVFRDSFHVFAGSGEVVLEFGNRDRLREQHVRIANRIVLSVGDAYRLVRHMERALEEASLRVQQRSSAP